MKCNKDCWWKPLCKQTKEDCAIIQVIDMGWKDSPNNNHTKNLSTFDKSKGN